MRGENTDSLPTDLIMEIFSRLHAKSIARFRCLSKLWGSILGRPYFTDLFFTRSSARPPRLLIASKQEGDEWCFFSSPQHQNPYEKSSPLVVTADCHMKFRGDKAWPDFRCHVSGLILFRRHVEKEYVICNPTTGQFGSLPLPKGRMPRSTELESFLGFDPIDKEFKLLSIRFEENQILTLGTGKDSWRKIHCPLTHSPRFYGICINGVLYYIAEQTYGRPSMIVCFDVRSEKFKFIRKDFLCDCGATKLINYKGKLGVVTLEYTYSSTKLCLWIMKDVENPESEWSEYFCKEYHYFGGPFSIVGVTATGDIVLSTRRSVPFYVFYIDPKTNTLQIVEIQGLGRIRDYDSVEVFTDYVEDLKFINKMTRYAATTIRPSAPEQKPKPTTTSTLSKASF